MVLTDILASFNLYGWRRGSATVWPAKATMANEDTDVNNIMMNGSLRDRD